MTHVLHLLLYTPISLSGLIKPYSFSLGNFIFFRFPHLLLYFPFSLSGLRLLLSLPSQCLFFLPSPLPTPIIYLFVCALPISLSLPSPRLVTLVIGLSKETYLIHCLDTCSTPPALHSLLSLWNNQAIEFLCLGNFIFISFSPPPSLFSFLSLWIKPFSLSGNQSLLPPPPCSCHFSLCICSSISTASIFL